MRLLVPLLACLLGCHVDASISVSSAADASSPAMVSAPIVKHPSNRNILVIGDSEAGRVALVLNKVANVDDKVEVLYKGGSTIEYWSKGAGNFKAELDKRPDLDDVIIFLGTNNYAATTLPYVQPILNAIGERRTNCIWVGPTSVHGMNWPVNDILEKSVTSVCSYFNTERVGIPLVDGIHPDLVEAQHWLGMVWLMVPPKD